MRLTSISTGSRSEPTGEQYADGDIVRRHTAPAGEACELVQLVAETKADAAALGRLNAALAADPAAALKKLVGA